MEGEQQRASVDDSRANGHAPEAALNPNPVPTDTLGTHHSHEHVDASAPALFVLLGVAAWTPVLLAGCVVFSAEIAVCCAA